MKKILRYLFLLIVGLPALLSVLYSMYYLAVEDVYKPYTVVIVDKYEDYYYQRGMSYYFKVCLKTDMSACTSVDVRKNWYDSESVGNTITVNERESNFYPKITCVVIVGIIGWVVTTFLCIAALVVGINWLFSDDKEATK